MKYILLTALLGFMVNVSAETRVLVVPAHYWSDGQYRQTLKWVFFDNGHQQCREMAKKLHRGKVSPAFSACTTEYESRKFK